MNEKFVKSESIKNCFKHIQINPKKKKKDSNFNPETNCDRKITNKKNFSCIDHRRPFQLYVRQYHVNIAVPLRSTRIQLLEIWWRRIKNLCLEYLELVTFSPLSEKETTCEEKLYYCKCAIWFHCCRFLDNFRSTSFYKFVCSHFFWSSQSIFLFASSSSKRWFCSCLGFFHCHWLFSSLFSVVVVFVMFRMSSYGLLIQKTIYQLAFAIALIKY